MSKRRGPGTGKCVHCLSDPVERNWDHVFPASWYPHSTPADLYKWQIPSCHSCNSDLGKMEDDFRQRIAMCLDPENPASQGIIDDAMRAIKHSAGKNERDRYMRAARARKLRGMVLEGQAIPVVGIYPGLGEKWDRPVQAQAAIPVPVRYFREITEKVVRGIFFIEDGRFIEPPFEVNFYVLADQDGMAIRSILNRFGKVYAREPGVVVRRAVAHEDKLSSIFEIEFWGQFKTYASVTEGS